MRRRLRPRPERAEATMRTVLDLKPGEQFERERRRGDPFPPQPGWTNETLAELNDGRPASYDGGDYVRVRRPMFTPADEAAAQYVGGFTQRIWVLARQGRFGEARRLAVQWGMPRGPQYRPAPGSDPYPPPADRDTQPWRRDTGPQPELPPYTPPPGSAAAAVRLLPSIPVRPPLAMPRRSGDAARRRLGLINGDYPRYDGYGHADQYAALMRRVALATGTHTQWEDPGAWAEPSTDAGAPVPVRRGLAITAGQRLPRRLPAAGAGQPGTGRHAAAGPPPPPAGTAAAVDFAVLARIHARLQNLPESRSA